MRQAPSLPHRMADFARARRQDEAPQFLFQETEVAAHAVQPHPAGGTQLTTVQACGRRRTTVADGGDCNDQAPLKIRTRSSKREPAVSTSKAFASLKSSWWLARRNVLKAMGMADRFERTHGTTQTQQTSYPSMLVLSAAAAANAQYPLIGSDRLATDRTVESLQIGQSQSTRSTRAMHVCMLY